MAQAAAANSRTAFSRSYPIARWIGGCGLSGRPRSPLPEAPRQASRLCGIAEEGGELAPTAAPNVEAVLGEGLDIGDLPDIVGEEL